MPQRADYSRKDRVGTSRLSPNTRKCVCRSFSLFSREETEREECDSLTHSHTQSLLGPKLAGPTLEIEKEREHTVNRTKRTKPEKILIDTKKWRDEDRTLQSWWVFFLLFFAKNWQIKIELKMKRMWWISLNLEFYDVARCLSDIVTILIRFWFFYHVRKWNDSSVSHY